MFYHGSGLSLPTYCTEEKRAAHLRRLLVLLHSHREYASLIKKKEGFHEENPQ
jgi:hypothetical protein